MPADKDMDRIPRAWVANVIYTIVGQPFRDFVNEQIERRNQTMISKRDLNITMDQAIFNAFQQSTSISSKSR